MEKIHSFAGSVPDYCAAQIITLQLRSHDLNMADSKPPVFDKVPDFLQKR